MPSATIVPVRCVLRLIAASLLMFPVVPCLASTLHVPADFPSVQAALNAAASGDTVEVASGRYTNQSITWPARNRIVLLGSASGGTVLVGNGGSAALFLGSSAIDTTTVIGDLHITHGRPGIDLSSASPTITRCTIDSCSGSNGGGVSMASTRGAVIRQCYIARNVAYANGGGIYSRYCESNRFIGNTIVYNTCGDAWGGGLVAADDGSPLISRNLIAYNSQLSNGGGGGGIATGGNQPTITDNVLVGNYSPAGTLGSALHVDRTGPCVFAGNIVTQNEGVAIVFGGPSAPEITRNTITENQGGIVITSAGQVHSNNFRGNVWAAVSGYVNAEQNWWGDPSGPTSPANPGGRGDGAVDCSFVPWLQVPAADAPPLSPTGLQVTAPAGGGGIPGLVWEAVPQDDILGYRVYYDVDAAGYPYEEMVDVGYVTDCDLPWLEDGVTYYLAVTAYDAQGYESWFSSSVSVAPPVSGVGSSGPAYGGAIATWPNPCSGRVTVTSCLREARGALNVLDTSGRVVRRLETGSTGGVIWDGMDSSGREAPAGAYVVTGTVGGRLVSSSKLLIVR